METPKEIWPLSPLARREAQQAMDHRAAVEREQVRQYRQDLENVHGQAVRDYHYFEQLIRGGIDFARRLGYPLGPVAVDIGSGTGVGATLLSHYPEIQRVYAVEFSEGFVDAIMPLTFAKFGARTEKIVRVVGDFHRLHLEDASVDLVLGLDALHHAEDLDQVLREVRRVLKPRGFLVAVDRGWPDHYTEAQLEAMLDQELHENLKRKYGIPLDQPFTRRDFGEHEYRWKDWEAAFNRNGLRVHIFRLRHPPALNRIWLRLPTFEFTVWLSSLQARWGMTRHILYGWGKKRILLVAFKQEA